jgi:hypothetical protein
LKGKKLEIGKKPAKNKTTKLPLPKLSFPSRFSCQNDVLNDGSNILRDELQLVSILAHFFMFRIFSDCVVIDTTSGASTFKFKL